jgi:hypothetical protein
LVLVSVSVCSNFRFRFWFRQTEISVLSVSVQIEVSVDHYSEDLNPQNGHVLPSRALAFFAIVVVDESLDSASFIFWNKKKLFVVFECILSSQLRMVRISQTGNAF